MKRLLPLVLTLLFIASCTTPTNISREGSDDTLVWVPEFIELHGTVTEMRSPMLIDGAVYFKMNVKVGENPADNPSSALEAAAGNARNDIYEEHIFKINPDGSGMEQIESAPPEYSGDNAPLPQDYDLSPITALGYSADTMIPLGSLKNGEILIAHIAEFIILRQAPQSEIKPKTELTLAAINVPQEIREEVIEFNRVSQEYSIKIISYGEIYPDIETAVAKLNLEIMAGAAPDIFVPYMMPYEQYEAKGVFEDLHPYLDSETELVPDFERVLTAADGKLYLIAPGMTLITLTGSSERVGAEAGWSMSELDAALSTAPSGAKAFPKYFTQADVLNQVISFNADEYIDYQTGECSFDTPEFIKLLEFVKSFPESYNSSGSVDDEAQFAGGALLVHLAILNSFNGVKLENIIVGGQTAYKGFPCESRSGSAAEVPSLLAINSASKNKDAAWSFVRKFITPDYQRSGALYGFPTNKTVFDEQVQEWTTDTYDSNGEFIPKGYIYKSDGTVDYAYYSLSDELLDRFMEFLGTVDSLTKSDGALYDIIGEDAAAYFEGGRSAEEAARIIQSRVSIYINEQR